MARAAEDTGSGPPFAKFNNLGDTLIGAFGSAPRECKRQRRSFESGEPQVKNDGTPALEEIMYFVAMPGSTAMTGTAETEFATIADGDHVRYSVAGFRWNQVITQRKALPAYSGFKAGQPSSGDIYTITLCGWSAETKNPAAAEKAGFTVVEGRIQLRSQDEKDRYVLAQSRSGGNTNPAKDFEITVRRPTTDEKRWEQAADELFDSKPWARQLAAVGASGGAAAEVGPADDEEPF